MTEVLPGQNTFPRDFIAGPPPAGLGASFAQEAGPMLALYAGTAAAIGLTAKYALGAPTKPAIAAGVIFAFPAIVAYALMTR